MSLIDDTNITLCFQTFIIALQKKCAEVKLLHALSFYYFLWLSVVSWHFLPNLDLLFNLCSVYVWSSSVIHSFSGTCWRRRQLSIFWSVRDIAHCILMGQESVISWLNMKYSLADSKAQSLHCHIFGRDKENGGRMWNWIKSLENAALSGTLECCIFFLLISSNCPHSHLFSFFFYSLSNIFTKLYTFLEIHRCVNVR